MDEPVRHNVTGLPTWSGSFSDGGQSYTYTMVGADPATGTSTTIPVTFIPIIFKIGTVTFDPTQNVNQFPANEITLLEQSPIFTPYPISAGPTNLGTSQGAKTNCCILGFHSQDGNFTYGTAAFNDRRVHRFSDRGHRSDYARDR